MPWNRGPVTQAKGRSLGTRKEIETRSCQIITAWATMP